MRSPDLATVAPSPDSEALSLGETDALLPPLQEAATLLAARGHEFVGEARPPSDVTVESRGKAVIATLVFPRRTCRLVLKNVTSNDNVRDVEKLKSVVAAISAQCPLVAPAFPRILGSGDNGQLMVMEYVAGRQFALRLRQELLQPGTNDETDAFFRKSARLFVEINRLSAEGLVSTACVRANETYIAGFRETADWFAASFQRAGMDVDHFLSRLSPAFFSRMSDRLTLVDCRPKNIIVQNSGGLAFIDIDFTAAPPAMSLAGYLVALDRFGCRVPSNRIARRVDWWKLVYADAYFACVDQETAEDFLFFYPWKLMRMFEQHRRHHPMFLPYLRWYYGRTLERFLNIVRVTPTAELLRRPADAFRWPNFPK